MRSIKRKSRQIIYYNTVLGIYNFNNPENDSCPCYNIMKNSDGI